jgi:DNA-binding GntR family transcriptional regulator
MSAKRVPRRNSAREMAHQMIHGRIVSGQYSPGMVLSELRIANELKSSRTPVREAIGQLVAEGLIEQIPNRGSVVTQLARADIIELYELREAIEVFAIQKVARRGLSPPEASQIRSSIESINELRREMDASRKALLDASMMERFLRVDLTFHALLLRAADNRRFLKLVSDMRLLIRIFGICHEGHTSSQLEDIARRHSAILDAVLRRDPETAAQGLSEHIRLSRDERLEAFDQNELERMTNDLAGTAALTGTQ